MKRKFIFIYAFFNMILFLIFNGATLYLLKYLFIPNISFFSIFKMSKLLDDVILAGKIYAVFFLFYLYIFPYLFMKTIYKSTLKVCNNPNREDDIKNDESKEEPEDNQTEIIDADTILK